MAGIQVLLLRPCPGRCHQCDRFHRALRKRQPNDGRDLRRAYGRSNRQQKDGTLDPHEALRMQLDEEGYIEWDLWCIDATQVSASRAAEKRGGNEECAIGRL